MPDTAEEFPNEPQTVAGSSIPAEEIDRLTADIIAALKGAEVLPIETLGAAAANAMIETGALPGLEAAVDEFGIDLFAEGDEDEAASPQPGAEE